MARPERLGGTPFQPTTTNRASALALRAETLAEPAAPTTVGPGAEVSIGGSPSESRSAAEPRRTVSWAQLTLATDGVMLAGASLAAGLLSPRPGSPIVWTLTFWALIAVFFYERGLYKPPIQLQIIESCRTVITSTALAAAIVISARVVLTDSEFVAAQTSSMWVFATLFLVAGRILVAVSERRARIAGESGYPTLIVGAGRVGRLVASRLHEHPEVGLRPVGFLDKQPLYPDDDVPGLPVLGASWDLERVVEDHGIKHVIVTFSTAPTEVLLRLMRRAEQLGAQTSFVPRLYERSTERFTVQHLGGVPLFSGESPNPLGLRFSLKYTADRLLAAVALVLLSPVLIAIAIAVLVSLGRPILYRQPRVGRDGVHFGMLKFRSMRPAGPLEEAHDAVSTDVAPGGVEGDDRRTRVGAILRKTSLDELPQLINVLRGEMSFVGPRPERPEFVEIFETHIDRYADRHRVKSGITGWAQVNGLRGKTSLSDRVEWDNYYIENWSLWFDVKILLLTVATVVRPREVE